MTEEIKTPTGEEVLEGEVLKKEVTEPEYSPEEQRALDDGWVPKEEWKGDPKDWRPAKEFNDRGELFNRIKSQRTEMDELKRAMTFLTEKDRQREVQAAQYRVNQLKTARDAALEEGDAVQAARIGDELLDAKTAVTNVKQADIVPKPATGPSDVFKAWHEKNKWYTKDEDATLLAEGKGERFRKNNPNASEAEMLEYVVKEVQKVFPDKFPARFAPSPGGSGRETPRGRGSDNPDLKLRAIEDEMSDENKSIMRTILKTTKMTKEEYLKQYAG